MGALSSEHDQPAAALGAANAADELEEAKAGAVALVAGKLDDLKAEELLARLERLARRAPGPELAKLISDLIEHRFVGDRQVKGEPLRLALLRAQQALGFPYALEVTPEHLELLRKHRSPHAGLRIWTGASALVALAWSGLLLNGSLNVAAAEREPAASVLHTASFAFLLAALHAVASLIATVTFGPARLLKLLGRLWLLGPFFSLLIAIGADKVRANSNVEFLLFGLFAALPSMVTAWSVGALARRAPPVEQKAPPAG